MSESDRSTSAPNPAARQQHPIAFMALLMAIAILGYLVLRRSGQSEPQLAGVPLPPLEVAGWFNTPAPLRVEDLRGKIVVLDCWFVGCPPCRAAMPQLVEFYNRFHDQGVELIGLSVDTGPDVDLAKEFVKTIPGMVWPIGYGAELPVQGILGIYEFPTLVVFDRSGRSFWAGHEVYELEDAVLKLLATEPPTPKTAAAPPSIAR